ncbi:general odorant-binding protein 56d-like [Microplitis mediator]|uniref:general odorant-binding protein 56d-like n=1 Tax=Microplitis mediator TaxID=375433 RepID=UPI002556CB4B|nr:general odorant-binding protein 56d-like [Microplitis mediator]XP_057329333.1 general odorant-binding protein 56d-like [Microplitis mediator]
MKIFAVIFAVCVVGALAQLNEDDEAAKMNEYRTACANETGFNDVNVSNIPVGNWITYVPRIQCYYTCIMKKMKIMNEDGTVNEEKTRKRMADKFPADKIDAVITKCKDLKGAYMCESVMMIMKCYDDEKASLWPSEKSA